MLLAPRPNSTLGDLLRLAAVWLVAVLLLQCQAAVHARSAGPLHLHRAPSGPAAGDGHHHHALGLAERHLHEAGDGSVLRLGAVDDELDAAALALAAAFALLATAGAPAALRPAAGPRGWPRQAAVPILSTHTEPLLKPPRPA